VANGDQLSGSAEFREFAERKFIFEPENGLRREREKKCKLRSRLDGKRGGESMTLQSARRNTTRNENKLSELGFGVRA
jgi:hypothetical protein